jgi:hypothetical protein
MSWRASSLQRRSQEDDAVASESIGIAAPWRWHQRKQVAVLSVI